MKTIRVTIKDIAKKVGVHHTTVSRALRNDPRVLNETKEKIQKAAKEMDYHYNFLAKSLHDRKTKTIGVIVPEIMHEFFGNVISGIEKVAYENDYNIMVCQTNEHYDREVINTKALISKQVDGLLVSVSQETKSNDHFKIVQDRGIPIVFFNRICDGIEASKVIVDDYGGAFSAVEHLIRRGHKRIAHFAGPEAISVSRNRLRAYKDALKKYGLPVREDLIIYGGFLEDDGASSTRKLVNNESPLPDAIFAVTDPVAIGALTVLKKMKIRVPEDIALAGFSDAKISSFIEPALTTVRQPTYEIGLRSMALLLKQIEENSNQNITHILDTELIIREST